MYLLDTCVCVEFLRGHLSYGYKLMRETAPANFRLPSIVIAELCYGAEHSADPERERALVDAFIEAFEVVPFDEACAREYGRIRQMLGSKGALIGDRDLMISATALAHRAILVTNNMKEFKRVPGLELESWSEIEM